MLGFDVSRLQKESRAILDEAPQLLGNLVPVWETWRAVNGQRNGLSAVLHSEVISYLNEEGITAWGERKRHRDAVRILDAEQLRLIDEDRKAEEARHRR